MIISTNGLYLVVGDIALATQTVVADAEGGAAAWKQGPPIDHARTYPLCRWAKGAEVVKFAKLPPSPLAETSALLFADRLLA